MTKFLKRFCRTATGTWDVRRGIKVRELLHIIRKNYLTDPALPIFQSYVNHRDRTRAWRISILVLDQVWNNTLDLYIPIFIDWYSLHEVKNDGSKLRARSWRSWHWFGNFFSSGNYSGLYSSSKTFTMIPTKLMDILFLILIVIIFGAGINFID